MSDVREFTGKTVEEAVTEASIQLGVSSDKFTYEVIEKESNGFLGLNKKPARIRVTYKMPLPDKVVDFLKKVLEKMEITADVTVDYNEEEKSLYANIIGEDMGVLIGKRGQTLDSLQYLVSLVVNKDTEEYIKVKLDTENYRERRKETLENLAKNIAFKVKKTRKSVALEPMNPYERRIIHSTIQNDKFVETHSEGEEPFRKVVISVKKGAYQNNYKRFNGNNKGYNGQRGNGSYHKSYNNNSNGGYRKDYKKDYKKRYNNNSTYTSDKQSYAAEKTSDEQV